MPRHKFSVRFRDSLLPMDVSADSLRVEGHFLCFEVDPQPGDSRPVLRAVVPAEILRFVNLLDE